MCNYGYIAQRQLPVVPVQNVVSGGSTYDVTNWCELFHNVILSTANASPARTITTNCFKWLSSKGHLFQNVALVQSGNSSIDEDKKHLHITRKYIPDSM